jgi:hypothetical protein
VLLIAQIDIRERNIVELDTQEYIMSEDYQKGFKDGFIIGLEEGKRNQNLNPVPSYKPWPEIGMMKETCPKCGIKISGVMGYVCTSPNCPSFYTSSYSGPQGKTSSSYSAGSNGPTEPIDYHLR